VPCKNHPGLVGKDWVSPAEPPDAVGDLLDLSLWMRPRISRIGAKIAEVMSRFFTCVSLGECPMIATIWMWAEEAKSLERYKKRHIGN
jgi:hypothetical protein